jgi:hypothetical protein
VSTIFAGVGITPPSTCSGDWIVTCETAGHNPVRLLGSLDQGVLDNAVTRLNHRGLPHTRKPRDFNPLNGMALKTIEMDPLPPRRECGAISFLSANPRSTFDSTAHFDGGDTTSLTLPAAVPADSLVCLGPNLLFVRLNCRGFFGECFILSTTYTPEHHKTPVPFCVRHNRPLAAAACEANLTASFQPTIRVEPRHHACRRRVIRYE